MNDDKFEIEYESSEENYREAYRFIYLFRPLKLMLMVLLGGVALLNLGYFLTEGNFISLVVPICCILLLISTIMSVRRMAAIAHRCDSGEATYRFFDDGMQILREGQKDRFVAFENFSWAHRSKHMIMIMLKGRELVLLPFDSFTIGTPNLLLRLLVTRGIQFK